MIANVGMSPWEPVGWLRKPSRLWLIGLVLVASLGAPRLATADPVGQITELSAGLNPGANVRYTAPGPDGNVWFTDRGSVAIGRINPSTGQITEFSSGLNGGSVPAQIAPGPDGNMWFVDQGSTRAIGRIVPSTGQITEFSSGAGTAPNGIAPGADGNVWFTDEAGAIGRIVTSTGQITEFSSGLQAGNILLGGLAPTADGNLWFTDAGTTRAIGRINPFTGQITEFFPSNFTLSDLPAAIAPGPDGNPWIVIEGTNTAIGRINRFTNQVTRFSSGLTAGDGPAEIAPGADGNLWFTERGSTPGIGRINPSTGQITNFSSGLKAGGDPFGIAPGADGNLWFADQATASALGRVGAGAPAAVQAPPSVSGAGKVGSAETCHSATLATWAGTAPSLSLYGFDGYRWLRDGTPIVGQIGQTYTTGSADAGHKLACEETATYPLPFLVTASPVSAAITVPATPALSGLRISPKKFSLTGRKVKGRCVKTTKKNNANPHCRRPIKLAITYTLSTAATVTFTVNGKVAGRKVKGNCVKQTNKNKQHKRCKRRVTLKGTITQAGKAGANTFTFKGKLGGHKLGPGAYILTATPNGGHPQTITFKIVR